MPTRTHNLFISHSWTYGTQYDGLVRLLEARPRFFFRNHSVPKDDPVHNAPTQRKLREAIRNHMSGCHVIIVLAGVYSTYSDWINTELALAESGFSKRKPVLAVRPRGNTRISSTVRDAADEIVNWNTSSIVTAIRDLSDA